MSQNVAIIGASDKPDRYSNKALKMLLEYSHNPLPIHPKLKEIEGISVFNSLKEASNSQKIDTVTMYVGKAKSDLMTGELLELPPCRVIFNPGSENPSLQEALKNKGFNVVEACTLVLLRTDQF
ncbi:MAG: CoA-binding protein [Deltaproteobacteria bacterium]|nr:CoA-binding protein [Deltaproteobacteria bacterium]